MLETSRSNRWVMTGQPRPGYAFPGGPAWQVTVTDPSTLVLAEMPLLLPTPEPGDGTPTPPPPSEQRNVSPRWSSSGWNVRDGPSWIVQVLAGRSADGPIGNLVWPHAAVTTATASMRPMMSDLSANPRMPEYDADPSRGGKALDSTSLGRRGSVSGARARGARGRRRGRGRPVSDR